MDKRIIVLAAAAFLVLAASVCTAQITVAADGTARSAIVLHEHASLSEKLAAEELVRYIHRISGAELQVSESAPRDRNISNIYIGTLQNSPGRVPPAALRKLEREGSERSFYLISSGRDLYITGKKPIGALYGAYALLEEYMGVRWFFPGELGEHVPENSGIVLGRIDDFQTPSLNMTVSFVAASYEFEDTMTWKARNRMTVYGSQGFRIFADRNEARGRDFLKARAAVNRRGGHSIFNLAVPGSKYFESNPEYFALLNGKRTYTETGREQRCVSNPEVLKLVEEMVLEHTSGENSEYLFGAEDRMGTWCQCEDCRKMGTVDGEFKVTNLVHRFFSEIAVRVTEKNPDARLSMHIYNDYRIPPEADDIVYGENMVGLYCSHQRCYVHAFNDPECAANRRQYGEFLRWMEILDGRVMLRDYMNVAKGEYAPFEYVLAEDLKHLQEIGAYGWTDEIPPVNAVIIPRILERYANSHHEWLSRWQTYYLAAKLGWNTDLDAGDFMEETYDIYYGSASSAMKEYHALRRRLWEAAPGHAFYGGPRRIGYCLNVPGAEEELEGYLRDAEELASGDRVVLERIAMDRFHLERFWKTSAAEIAKLFSAESMIIPQRAHSPITIDGELSEAAWLSARPVDNFISLTSGDAPVEKTTVRVLYDDDNLYFGIVAMAENTWGDPFDLKADAETHGRVWSDDSVEIQIAPPGDEIFYHVMSNTEGVIYDSRAEGSHFDTSYDSKVEVAVKKLADRQIYEFRVPLEPMGIGIIPGQTWGMHFVRNCRSLQPPVTGETSTVDGTRPHVISNFRRAVFGENAVRNGNFSDLVPAKEGNIGVTGEYFINGWGVNSAECEVIRGPANSLRLKNGTIYSFMRIPPELASRPLMIKGEISAQGDGEMWVRMSTSVIPPGSGKRFSHDRREDLERWGLEEKPGPYQFEYVIDPYEQGYIYVYVSGEAVINNVSAVLTER